MKPESHIQLVGILHLVHSGLMILIGLFLFGLLTGIGVFTGDEDAFLVLGIIGSVAIGILFLLSVPGIIGGIALLRHASWSRIFMIVLGALKLIDIPLGTTLGVYTIYALLRPDVIAILDQPAKTTAVVPA